MKLSEFSAKPCNSRAAFEFIPKKRHSIDLEKTARELEKDGALIEAETSFLLALKREDTQISLFSSGKMIVKTEDQKKARELAKKTAKKAALKW